MSFSAHNEDGVVYSYRLDESEWAELKKTSSLKLACCDKNAVFKETKDGIRYFDHEKTENCCSHSVDVSSEYLMTKFAMINILIQRGWSVESDKRIQKWSADIYTESKLHKMCIFIRTVEPSIKEIDQVDKFLAKDNIKTLWFVKFKNNTRNSPAKYCAARENISKYNNKANVLELIKKKSGVSIGGLFSINNDNKTQILGQVEDLELSDFVQAFFVEKRIKRHKLNNNLLFNFEHSRQKCSRCKSDISGIVNINVAVPIEDIAVRFTGVGYEQIEDKVIFSHINKYSKDNYLGFALTWIPEYSSILDDEIDVAIQYCLYCSNRFRTSRNKDQIVQKSEYMPTTLRNTDIGSRFGAIWIISPPVEAE